MAYLDCSKDDADHSVQVIEPISIGYWSEERIKEMVDVDWAASEEARFCELYLRNGYIKKFIGNKDNCSICDFAFDDKSDMQTVDGKYIYPKYLWHYIKEHGCRPRQFFIDDAIEWCDQNKETMEVNFKRTCQTCGKQFEVSYNIFPSYCPDNKDCGHLGFIQMEMKRILDREIDFRRLDYEQGRVDDFAKEITRSNVPLSVKDEFMNMHQKVQATIDELRAKVTSCMFCGETILKEIDEAEDVCVQCLKYAKIGDISVDKIMEDYLDDTIKDSLLYHKHGLRLGQIQKVIKGDGSYCYRVIKDESTYKHNIHTGSGNHTLKG